MAGYLDGWLERVRHDVRASTLVAYRNAVSHVVAGLGHLSLGSLTARQVQGWQRALLDERGLSPKTVANVHAVLHRALADAVRLELLDRNVASLVDPPRAQWVRKIMLYCCVKHFRTQIKMHQPAGALGPPAGSSNAKP